MCAALIVLAGVLGVLAGGGVAHILSLSVTSLRPHWLALGALPWALLVTQEARAFEGDSFVRAARRDGMDVALFPPGTAARRCSPFSRAAHILHLLWTPRAVTCGACSRPPPCAAMGGAGAAARACAAEALLTPLVPSLILQ